MSPADLIFAAIVGFVIVVFAIVLGRVVAKEARENREALEAHEQPISWKDIIG